MGPFPRDSFHWHTNDHISHISLGLPFNSHEKALYKWIQKASSQMCQFDSEGTLLLRTVVIYHCEPRPSLVPRLLSVTTTLPHETKMTIFWQILLLHIGIGTTIEREYGTKGQHVPKCKLCKLSNVSLSRGLIFCKTSSGWYIYLYFLQTSYTLSG